MYPKLEAGVGEGQLGLGTDVGLEKQPTLLCGAIRSIKSPSTGQMYHEGVGHSRAGVVDSSSGGGHRVGLLSLCSYCWLI